MVLLTMTPAMVAALSQLSQAPNPKSAVGEPHDDQEARQLLQEAPDVGKPISHTHIVWIWEQLCSFDNESPSLERLLADATVYIAPLKPRPEPTAEYKALMARLRHQEELQRYKRMTAAASPKPIRNSAYHVSDESNMEDSNAAVFKDINQQLTLILNFLVSMVGVSVSLWIAARWWDTPWRLLLSLAGAGVVGVAEVVVYMLYVARLEQAAGKQEVKEKETRQVVQTWVVGASRDKDKAGKGENAHLRTRGCKTEK